jgi:DNA-binding transcriptional ArsR family regulator
MPARRRRAAGQRSRHAAEDAADQVFAALADRTRRALLDQLRHGDRPVHALAESFQVSRPAISQHLRVLRDAGLVAESRVGRERFYRLQADALREVADWLRYYEGFWADRLDALGAHLETMS